ncbi:hypothetical protein [Achromobacter sp.]|uniref:hypothetical protein n=1 Tax=Achromobacter sp. TaxID=134375 RepID=UPI0028AE7B3C|nr:hypothetical protein [Achromobacter sp.]
MSPLIRVIFPWQRRLWQLAFVALLFLQAGMAAAQSFDRHAENLRYQQWLRDFRQDLLRLRDSADPAQADIDALFARTVVPGSRATTLLRKLAAAAPDRTRGEIHFAGIQRVFLAVLSDSIVAGDGGIYPDTHAAYQKDVLHVRYLHVDGGGRLERYFSDPAVFKPYRLPDAGVYQRDVYPFLLFEERDGKLRLGGVSKEFWDLVRFMDAQQYA